MKKSLITLSICLIAVFAFAQSPVKKDSLPVKQDTVFVFNMADFKELATAIDQNVDSKTMTQKIIAFIRERGRIIPQQPADKPKKP